jgi:hypothetical protein
MRAVRTPAAAGENSTRKRERTGKAAPPADSAPCRSRRRFGDAIGKIAEASNVNFGGQSDAHRAALNMLGTLETVHLLHDAPGFMAIASGQPEIWILVHSPDTTWGIWDQPWYRQAKFYFDGGDEYADTRSFVRLPYRRRVNRWGIMLGIARIISEFSSHPGGTSASRAILNMDMDIEV